jgi:hypothetical protein
MAHLAVHIRCVRTEMSNVKGKFTEIEADRFLSPNEAGSAYFVFKLEGEICLAE